MSSRKHSYKDLLKNQNFKTALAYHIILTFQDIFINQNRHQGVALLKGWM